MDSDGELDETEDAVDHLRRLLCRRRVLRLDVRECPDDDDALVSGEHLAMDLHDVHVRRRDLPHRARRARREHPPLVRSADSRPRGEAAARPVPQPGSDPPAPAPPGHAPDPGPRRPRTEPPPRAPMYGRTDPDSG